MDRPKLTKEDVAAIHVRIKLLADPLVEFDNDLTGLRETWKFGELISTTSYFRHFDSGRWWATDPNPWRYEDDDDHRRPLPY